MPEIKKADCPSHEELVAFSLGNVTQQALETIAGHLETCESCATALSTVRESGDSLLSGLRGHSLSGQFLDEPEYRQAVERVQGIGFDAVSPDTSPAQTPRPGPKQFGRYEVIAELGQGGMGTVYLARDTQLDREVALKIPHFRRSDDPRRLERFSREARAASAIEHPNLCPVYDVGEIDGVPFLSMARIRGQSLSRILKGGRRFPEREAAEIVRKVALAVDKAHAAGIVHRDLKPSNIMLTEEGEPILTDFGLAQRLELEDPRLTRSGIIVGTPSYMAPEQVDGDPQILGAASDVYGLGVVLYELLTGRVPFEGPLLSVLSQLGKDQAAPPSTHRADLDRRLEAICLRAIAKNPADRYESAGALAEALEQYLGSAAPPAYRRRLARLGVAAAGAILLLALVIHFKTNKGTLVLEVDPPDVSVTIDGNQVDIKSPRDEIRLSVGKHDLEVTKDGFQTHTDSFTVRRRGKVELRCRLEPMASAMTKPVFEDNFDRSPTGALPAGWTDSYVGWAGAPVYTREQATAIGLSISVDDEVHYGPSGKSLHFLDNNVGWGSGWGSQVTRSFAPAQTVILEYYIRSSKTGIGPDSWYEAPFVALKGDSTTNNSFYCLGFGSANGGGQAGYIGVIDAIRGVWADRQLLPYQKDTWYYVRNTVDIPTKTIEFYVQQADRPSINATFRREEPQYSNTHLDEVMFCTGNSSGTDAYIDEVSVSAASAATPGVRPKKPQLDKGKESKGKGVSR